MIMRDASDHLASDSIVLLYKDEFGKYLQYQVKSYEFPSFIFEINRVFTYIHAYFNQRLSPGFGHARSLYLAAIRTKHPQTIHVVPY
jgi:hypothetical protein